MYLKNLCRNQRQRLHHILKCLNFEIYHNFSIGFMVRWLQIMNQAQFNKLKIKVKPIESDGTDQSIAIADIKKCYKDYDEINLMKPSYSTIQKLINENGDKISDDNKSQINQIKDKLSAQLSSEEENAEEITNLTNELQSKMQEIGQDIYSQAPPENNENNEDRDDSDTIEGEYKEV